MTDDNLPVVPVGKKDGDDSSSSSADSLNDKNTNGEAGSTEAGIVRGVSRSMAQRAVAARSAGRSLAKLPSVGRLPRSAQRGRTMVPVKRVAKVTDRMSQGLDVWELASSSSKDSTTTATKERQQPKRIRQRYAPQIAWATTFGTSLVKNTVLGTIVFESYCWMVANTDSLLRAPTKRRSPGEADHIVINNTPAQGDHEQVVSVVPTPIYRDVFETTPVVAHYMAGAVGGSLQGVFGSLWDTTALSLASRKLALPTFFQPLVRNIVQHAVAHSILFGSYETCKRLILGGIFDSNSDDPGQQQQQQEQEQLGPVASLLPHQRLEYFTGVAVAGGMAGQLQHIASFMLEQQPGAPQNFLRWSALPSLRSTLWAFPPSAIAFLAFEYGKDAVVELATDDDIREE